MGDHWERLVAKRAAEAREGLRRVFDPERVAARARRRAAAANRRQVVELQEALAAKDAETMARHGEQLALGISR